MLVGQQLGPFLIEKELGAGAMGAVYRGKYLKTGQLVAVKVMAPGTASASGAARFERESAVLKQLNHPNIVRLFGVGKYQGTPYFAMEYVQGESLDKVMARRDRMTWEEVVALGQQLCAALQHAHDAGIVHRDLKPSNLMILADGTLKLTDFGIAKDLDVTALTGANNTIGTAAYMSPEQCKGDPHLSPKSDLYSLGVVLYELVTGRKPFVAESAMELFMMHVSGSFERPSRLALEVPPWLDTVICQLLEKKPEQRPLDAAMVGKALASVREKVEQQQSAGVEAARDRTRGPRKLDDEDRLAAKTLAGRKPRRGGAAKKKQRMPAWLIAAQAVGILAALAAVVAVLIVLLRPPSPEALYVKAEKLWASGDPAKQRAARDGPIADYQSRYGDRDDDKSRQIKTWQVEYDVREFETFMDRHVKHETTGQGMKLPAKSDAEKAAFAAAVYEHEGKRDKAAKAWAEAKEMEPATRVGLTATAHLKQLDQLDATERAFAARKKAIRDDRAEPAGLSELERSAFQAWRMEALGDRYGARAAYARLRDAAREANQRYWALFGAAHERRANESLKKDEQDRAGRKEVVEKLVEDEAARYETKRFALLDVRAPLHEVVTLYEGESDLKEPVAKAKALVATIDDALGRK